MLVRIQHSLSAEDRERIDNATNAARNAVEAVDMLSEHVGNHLFGIELAVIVVAVSVLWFSVVYQRGNRGV